MVAHGQEESGKQGNHNCLIQKSFPGQMMMIITMLTMKLIIVKIDLCFVNSRIFTFDVSEVKMIQDLMASHR